MSAQRLSHSRRRTVIAVAIAALFGGVTAADAADPTSREAPAAWCADRCDELVIDWNATAYQVIKADENYANPMSASRSLAMMHLAMHDAVNAAQPRYAAYAYTERDSAADPAVAAVTAAHDVLAALYPKQAVLLKAALDKSLVDAGTTAAATRGIALGRSVAAAVLRKRAADGSAANVPYQQGSKPGEYRFTQGFDFAASSAVAQRCPVHSEERRPVPQRTATGIDQRAVRSCVQRSQDGRRQGVRQAHHR